MSANIYTPQAKELKRQALELLEWAMDDMSQAGGPKLYLKCGIEREGHFLPDSLNPPSDDVKTWKETHREQMHGYAKLIEDSLKDDNDVGRIYHDQISPFMIEGVTKPLGLVASAEAAERISRRMLAEGGKIGLTHRAFGSLPIGDTLEALSRGPLKECFAQQVIPPQEYHQESADACLTGRGQHANLSVWLGDRNLFQRNSMQHEILHTATKQALDWLPAMFLPYRNGNYHRLQSGGQSSYTFSATDLDHKKAGQVMRVTGDRVFRGWKPESLRLEFRQATPEADPYDVVLAAAAPLVFACDKYIGKENGKILLTKHYPQLPKLARNDPFPSDVKNDKLVPKTEAEAKNTFNTPANPYFTYLNELADRKIAKAEEMKNQHPSSVLYTQQLRDASKLKGMGSRLHALYCQEYGMQSRMPQPEYHIAI